jgi:hypothetical protein
MLAHLWLIHGIWLAAAPCECRFQGEGESRFIVKNLPAGCLNVHIFGTVSFQPAPNPIFFEAFLLMWRGIRFEFSLFNLSRLGQ